MKTPTWGECLDYTWKIHWRRMASAGTSRANAGHITEYAGRSLPISRMAKAGWWMELIAGLQDEGRSRSTINRIISAGTTVMRFTRKAGLHEIDVPAFDRLKEGEHRLTWFTKEDVQTLVHNAVDIYNRKDLADAILFSAYTGIRQGELLKLRAEDVDLTHDRIWVGGRPGRETKGKEVRSIPIHPSIKQIVMNRLSQKLLFGEDWLNKDQLYAAFKKVRDYSGFSSHYVWHSLRHSFGTFLGEVTHPRQIMALMGHKNIETSLRYVKATDEATKAAVLAI